MMLNVVRTCGANVVKEHVSGLLWIVIRGAFKPMPPYDAIICDMFDAIIQNGKSQKVKLLGIKECSQTADGKPAERRCVKSFIGHGSKIEIFRSIFSAISGMKIDESEEGIANEIVTSYKACNIQHKDVMKCLSFSFVEATCSGICRSTKCQLKAYRKSSSELCRNAVDSGCPALVASADSLCRATLSAIDSASAAAFPRKKCDAQC